jgi:hypothetical protein
MNFIGGNARHAEFDKVVSQASEVLQRPEVAQALSSSLLGQEVADFITAGVEHAIMPNVVDGVISMPRRYAKSDAVMIVPVLPGETSLHLDISAEPLTPHRMQEIADTLASLGYNRKTSRRLAEDVREHMARTPSQVLGDPANVMQAQCRGTRCAIENTELVVSAKPFISVRAARLEHYEGYGGEAVVGAFLGHELTHVSDLENRLSTQCPSSEHTAYDEGRGYYAGGIILEAGTPPDLSYDYQRGREVEHCRQEFATPENPFPASPEFAAAMRLIGAIPLAEY